MGPPKGNSVYRGLSRVDPGAGSCIRLDRPIGGKTLPELRPARMPNGLLPDWFFRDGRSPLWHRFPYRTFLTSADI
eukprot:6074847-Pyramimonas_sp.AAC.1